MHQNGTFDSDFQDIANMIYYILSSLYVHWDSMQNRSCLNSGLAETNALKYFILNFWHVNDRLYCGL